MRSFLKISCFLTVLIANAQLLKPGKWSGFISYENADVPILFEIIPTGEDVPEFVFTNGKERRTVQNAVIRADSVFIPMDPFDVIIKAKFSGMSMSGVYFKNYRDVGFPMEAKFGGVRFAKKSTKANVKIEEKWDMTFNEGTASESKGVGIFKQLGDLVTGTVISETSDYRYFEGIIDGDSIKLSSFDGAHAFMILGKKTGGTEWSGEIIFDNNYSEPWVATYDEEANLVDPFAMVEVEPGVHKPYYDLLGAGSGDGSIDITKYEGKVLLIQLFGTWCPNSHDQTKYLVEWYKKNKDRGVSILASSYEANYSKEYGLARIEEYKEVNGISYDMVLGGRLSKRSAAMPFPFMERIEAFPTLVILDKNGFVRYVNSYFNGPATGSYYDQFDKRFNEIVNELLSE